MLGLAFLFTAGYGAPVSAVSEGLLSVRGTSIVNPTGVAVVLRGVNYDGYQLDADIQPHTEPAYKGFAELGFNVVRLPIAWSKLEPFPGFFNEQFLRDYVDNDVRWAKKYGIYIVLDMHQLKWGAQFGGYGVPDWVTIQYPGTDEGMRRAVTDFWVDAQLQDHFIQVWRKVAHRYANETTIAGYDLLNEPWVYTSIVNLNASFVDAFYVKAISSIRKVDSRHIIILEPANMFSARFPIKENIVWSPHFYALAFQDGYQHSNAYVLRQDLSMKYRTFVVGYGSPMWIGEFGAFMKDSSQEDWIRDAVDSFSTYQLGWAWWAYNEGGGVPRALYTKPGEQVPQTIQLGISDLEWGLLVFAVVVFVASVVYSVKGKRVPARAARLKRRPRRRRH